MKLIEYMVSLNDIVTEMRDFFKSIRLNTVDKIPQRQKWFIYYRVKKQDLYYLICSYIFVFTGINFKIGGSKK